MNTNLLGSISFGMFDCRLSVLFGGSCTFGGIEIRSELSNVGSSGLLLSMESFRSASDSLSGSFGVSFFRENL